MADLDIANVYFRSRERQDLLARKGVEVYAGAFGHEITAELPAIDPAIRKPLEDRDCYTVIDAGGDQSGARILVQFSKYLCGEDAEMLCVVNANRPETETAEGVLRHIRQIEAETGISIRGLVNNTHLLKETRIDDILKGYELCKEVSLRLGIPVRYHCCREDLCEKLQETGKISEDNSVVFPMELYMRPSWLDAK